MGAMGNELLNVADALDGSPGVMRASPLVRGDLAAAGSNSASLQRMIDTLHGRGGGTLWFPAGVWYLGRRGDAPLGDPAQCVDAGDVVVYDDITLWFAGGAVLAPLGGSLVAPRDVGDPDENRRVRVEIHGALEVHDGPVFQASGADRGLVLLAGDRVPEVDLSWWLADRPELPADRHPTVAARLQSAMDAAHRHRVRLLRRPDGALARGDGGALVYRRRPALPMVCHTELVLDGPLTLGATEAELRGFVSATRPFNSDPFVLRGERGPGTSGAGRVSLRASSRGLEGAAMLSVRGVASFRIEGLNLHGNSFATRGLDLTFDGARRGAATLEGCTMQGARSTQVRVTTSHDAGRPAGVSVVTLSRCRIETTDPGNAASPPVVHTPAPTRGGIDGHDRMGVVFDGGEAVRLELRACIGGNFGANPLVSAVSGALSLRECELHCDRVLDARPAAEINAQGRTTNGTDVVVEPARRRDLRGWLEPASVAMREVESQSWQLLMSYAELTPEVPSTSTVVVANANATNANMTPPGWLPRDARARWVQLHDAPAIVWSSPARSAHMTLLGVVLGGRGAAGSSDGMTRVRGPDGGCVVLLPDADGTVLEAGLVARRGSLDRALGATGTHTEVTVQRIPVAGSR